MKKLWLIAVSVTVLLAAGERAAQAGARFSVGISINRVDDFYEPLRSHGHWVTLQPYGRCWYPAYVAADWRPYADGHWEWTDEGWYWVSEEDWGWATYHYGRWVWDSYYGWVWAPDTEWAPAWVAWREGPDYIGWAPLPPRCDYGPSGVLIVERIVWAPRAFVFVEHRHFCRPVREHIVINQTIINQTINITKIEKVQQNNVVIHNGPTVAGIEKRTGTKVAEVRATDLWRERSERTVERATHSRLPAPPVVKAAATTPSPTNERGPAPGKTLPPSAVARGARPAVEPPTVTPAPATEERVPSRRQWTPPEVWRGRPREVETPRTVEPTPSPVTPPSPPPTEPPVVTERPNYGRRQWTPPTVTRGAQREDENPGATDRRREYSSPPTRHRVEEAPPTVVPPPPAPERAPGRSGSAPGQDELRWRGNSGRGNDEEPPRGHGNSSDRRGNNDRRGSDTSGSVTNQYVNPRGR